jgi:hypothetical protein
VLYAVTKLDSVDVRSLCVCAVCGRMSLLSVNLVRESRNERTSTQSNFVIVQSTAHETPEYGRKYGPKHVGTTLVKCF